MQGLLEDRTGGAWEAVQESVWKMSPPGSGELAPGALGVGCHHCR